MITTQRYLNELRRLHLQAEALAEVDPRHNRIAIALARLISNAKSGRAA